MNNNNNGYLLKIIKNELNNMKTIRSEIAKTLSMECYSSVDKSSIITSIDILNQNIEVLEKSDDTEKISRIISGLPALYITIRSIECLK